MNATITKIIVYVCIALLLFGGGAAAGYFFSRGNFSGQLDDARAEVTELEELNTSLAERNEELRANNRDITQRIEELQREREEAERALDNLEESLGRAQAEADRATETLRTIRDGIDSTSTDIGELVDFVRRIREELRAYFAST